jgi:hypothetical protein
MRLVLRPAVLRTLWSELDHLRFAQHGDLKLRVVDLRPPPERAPDSVVAQVSAALQLISEAKQGFGELVADHLKQVIVAKGVRVLSVNPPAYWESFDWEDSVDPHRVACMLIWAATAIRLYRDARRFRHRIGDSHVEDVCWEAQERFLKQFPDGDWWIKRMRPKGSAV